MNRMQFMEQLEKLLSDISEAERLEALDYYNSYFDDAGEENEAAVIRELGSPGKVAAIIKADLRESNEEYSQYTELGYEDTRTAEPRQVPGKYPGKETADSSGTDQTQDKKSFEREKTESDAQREQRARNRAEKGYHAEKKTNHARIILVLILLVFLSPFLSSAVGGILGIVIAVVLLPFIAIFVSGICSVAFLVAGIVCVAVGIAICFGYPASGILTIGIGCLMVAAAILCLIVLVWIAGWLLPKLLNKFTTICHNILQKERKDGK